MQLTYSISFGDLDEFCLSRGIIRVLVRMLLARHLPVSLSNFRHCCFHGNTQDFVRDELFDTVHIPDSIITPVAQYPSYGDKYNPHDEHLIQVGELVDLLSRCHPLFANVTLAVFDRHVDDSFALGH